MCSCFDYLRSIETILSSSEILSSSSSSDSKPKFTVSNITSPISNKMAFLGTALALDSAISLSVGIRDTGNTGITCTYQNKYTGAIPNLPIRFHFMLIVKK